MGRETTWALLAGRYRVALARIYREGRKEDRSGVFCCACLENLGDSPSCPTWLAAQALGITPKRRKGRRKLTLPRKGRGGYRSHISGLTGALDSA